MNNEIENKNEQTEELEKSEGTRACPCIHKNCCQMNKCILNNQNDMPTQCLKIGDMAPEFVANTTFGEFRLSDYRGRWVVLFSHPGDFTPVCTTEFIAFSNCYPEFKKLNTELLGLSIDSTPSHLDWVYNIYKNSGVRVPFPVISDRDGNISRMYGMLPGNMTSLATVRSVYIIDPDSTIRMILTYPKEIGRNISEILRCIEALQVSDAENVVIPANWIPGMPVITKSPSTYQELIERVQNSGEYSCFDWYLCFKNLNSNIKDLGGGNNE